MNARNNNFALLHYVAACMIILGHMFVLTGGAAPGMLGTNILEIGVSILFVISGFLVAKSFLREPSLVKFWAKRLLRLYPALCVCVVACAAGGYVLSALPLAEYIPGALVYIIDNLLMRPQFYLPGVFADNPHPISVNGSLWTLPVELAFFLLTPIYLLIIQRTKHKAAFCASIASLLSLCAIYVNWYCAGTQLVFRATDWMQAVRLGSYFLWGITYSMLKPERLKKLCRGDIAVLLLGMVLCLGSHYSPKLNYFFVPYVTISFAFAGDGILRDFLNKHDYVYGMYLWAFPVQQTVIYLFQGIGLPPVLILFVICVGITLLLAMLTNRFVEEPVRKITARYLK